MPFIIHAFFVRIDSSDVSIFDDCDGDEANLKFNQPYKHLMIYAILLYRYALCNT